MSDLEQSVAIAREFRALPEFKPLKSNQRRFLLAFSKTMQVQSAAKLSGVEWINHYKWLQKSIEYKQAFEFAKQMAGDYAEGDVYQRAFIGEERTVTKIKGDTRTIEEYKDKSDLLAIFMLKGLKPQYRDSFNINNLVGPTSITIQGPGDKPVDVSSIPPPATTLKR